MQDFVKTLAKKHKMDTRVVNHIVGHPSRFIRKLIASTDTRPVRLMHFGIFSLKHENLKYYKSRDKLEFMKRHYNVLKSAEQEYNFNADELLKHIEDSLLSGEYNDIIQLYSFYTKVIKKILNRPKLKE